MELGDLVAASLPGDPAVVRATAEQLGELVAQAARVRGGLEFGLDLTRPRPGDAPDPRRSQGIATLDRLRAEEAAARAQHRSLLAFAERLEQRKSELVVVRDDLNAVSRNVQLLPARLGDGPGPWWACTRIGTRFARPDHLVTDGLRPVSVGTPALVDVLYLTLSLWRRTDAATPVEVAAAADFPLGAFLAAGTTIAPASDVAVDDRAPVEGLDTAAPVMLAADEVVVSTRADPRTLAVSQAWLTPATSVLAEGDGATVRARALPTESVAGELAAGAVPHRLASEPTDPTLTVSRDAIERLVAPDAVVRVRAAEHLRAELPVLGAGPLASALDSRTWRVWAVSVVRRADGIADGEALLALLAPAGAWLARAVGDLAILEPVAGTALTARLAALVDA